MQTAAEVAEILRKSFLRNIQDGKVMVINVDTMAPNFGKYPMEL